MIHRKNAEVSKNLRDYRNNYVERSSVISNAAKSFDILAISVIILMV